LSQHQKIHRKDSRGSDVGRDSNPSHQKPESFGIEVTPTIQVTTQGEPQEEVLQQQTDSSLNIPTKSNISSCGFNPVCGFSQLEKGTLSDLQKRPNICIGEDGLENEDLRELDSMGEKPAKCLKTE
jgi:hypothetical protein